MSNKFLDFIDAKLNEFEEQIKRYREDPMNYTEFGHQVMLEKTVECRIKLEAYKEMREKYVAVVNE